MKVISVGGGSPDFSSRGSPMQFGVYAGLSGGIVSTRYCAYDNFSVVVHPVPGPGDCDGDGDADLVDFGAFRLVFTG